MVLFNSIWQCLALQVMTEGLNRTWQNRVLSHGIQLNLDMRQLQVMTEVQKLNLSMPWCASDDQGKHKYTHIAVQAMSYSGVAKSWPTAMTNNL